MKQATFFCVLLLIFSACKKEKLVNEASGSFYALTYNVAGLPEELSGSHPEQYTSLISPLLNDFDIVHVQEDFCYHDSLLLFNNHRYKTPPTPCVPDGDGLNTFSNYKIIAFERITWNDCNSFDCLTPKGFSYSKIEFDKGVYIDFYNLHCNAGKTVEDKAARRNNLKQLINYINIKSIGQAVILMGDFNNYYTRSGDSIRVFQDLGFSDVWIDIVRNGDVPFQNDIKLDNCNYTLNSSFDCEGVDKVLYRSTDEMQIEAVSYQYGDDINFYYGNNDTLPLSDHSPLMVRFDFDFKRK